MQELWLERPIPHQFLSYLLSQRDSGHPVVDPLIKSFGGTKVIIKWIQKDGVWKFVLFRAQCQVVVQDKKRNYSEDALLSPWRQKEGKYYRNHVQAIEMIIRATCKNVQQSDCRSNDFTANEVACYRICAGRSLDMQVLVNNWKKNTRPLNSKYIYCFMNYIKILETWQRCCLH